MNRNNVVETDTRAISSLTLKKKSVFNGIFFFTLGIIVTLQIFPLLSEIWEK